MNALLVRVGRGWMRYAPGVMPGWRSKRISRRANGITLPVCGRPSRIDCFAEMMTAQLRPPTRRGPIPGVDDLSRWQEVMAGDKPLLCDERIISNDDAD